MLLASVRVGVRDRGEEMGWISKIGREEVSEGEMMLPRDTVWWLEGYDREREKDGEKSSRTAAVSWMLLCRGATVTVRDDISALQPAECKLSILPSQA